MRFTPASFAPAARKVALATATVALAGTALVAPAAPAHAEDAFAITAVTGVPAVINVPTSSTTIPFTVTFSGPAVSTNIDYDSYDSSYNDASVTAISSLAASPSGPSYVTSPSSSSLKPGTALAYSFTVDQYTDPGRYRLTIPLRMNVYDPKTYTTTHTDQATTVDFDVVANPAVTIANDTFDGWGKYSKKSKWTWYYTGPDYLKGAHLKVYYKAKGKKSFKLIANKYINSAGDVPTFKTKKGAITKKGQVYYVVTAVSWSGEFRSGNYQLVTR